LRNDADAEELVWYVFGKLHEHRSSYRNGADVVPWAYAIARRRLIDVYRRDQRSVEDFVADHDAPSTDGRPDDLYISKDLARTAMQILEGLPEETRRAFFLVREEGLSLAEVSQILDTSVGAVKQRLHRASEALRPVLQPTEGDGR
jgi:RNA polymerase sigma-70 factor (ECF subfamily)